MIWFLLGVLHPWLRVYNKNWWSSLTWKILAFFIISLVCRFFSIRKEYSYFNRNTKLIYLIDLVCLIVSRHQLCSSQTLHLPLVARHPVLISPCTNNWSIVCCIWPIPNQTSLLKLDLSLGYLNICKRLNGKQQSEFSNIFRELPSSTFNILLVLFGWKVSTTLIGLVQLMIASPHQALFISLVLLLFPDLARNN